MNDVSNQYKALKFMFLCNVHSFVLHFSR